MGTELVLPEAVLHRLSESPPATLEHPELQAANNDVAPHATPKDDESLLRYDVEVSGFPSSLSGHLVLLRLKEQDYPGTKLIEDWPSWNLPVLKWAERRAASSATRIADWAWRWTRTSCRTTRSRHSIPSARTKRSSTSRTARGLHLGRRHTRVAELNAWYHLLNCGFRLAIVGETDYPCITGERVGSGRSYVRLEHRPIDDVGYNAWVNSLTKGRLYCGDGRSHFLEFGVNGRASGDEDVKVAKAGTVKIDTGRRATRTGADARDRAIRANVDGTWHIEHARIGNTRTLAVDLVANGIAVDRATLVAEAHRRRFVSVLHSRAVRGWRCGSGSRAIHIRCSCRWRAKRSAHPNEVPSGAARAWTNCGL